MQPSVAVASARVIVAQGTRIGPAQISVLASFGYVEVPVVRPPSVSIVSTGNELVEVQEQPGPGQLRESNRYMLRALIEEENNAGAKSDDSDDEGAAEAPTHARPSLSTPYEAPANAIEEAVAEIWQGILGISQIGANDDFTEIGGNSLLAVQATAITSDTFSVDLAIDSFTKNPTVRGLAEAVMERLVSMASEETLEEMISELDEV